MLVRSQSILRYNKDLQLTEKPSLKKVFCSSAQSSTLREPDFGRLEKIYSLHGFERYWYTKYMEFKDHDFISQLIRLNIGDSKQNVESDLGVSITLLAYPSCAKQNNRNPVSGMATNAVDYLQKKNG